MVDTVDNMPSLPAEILLHILSWTVPLGLSTLCSLSLTCSSMRYETQRAIYHTLDTRRLWESKRFKHPLATKQLRTEYWREWVGYYKKMQCSLLQTLKDSERIASYVDTFILFHNEGFSISNAYETLLNEALGNMLNLKTFAFKPTCWLMRPKATFGSIKFQLKQLSWLSDFDRLDSVLPFLKEQKSLEYINSSLTVPRAVGEVGFPNLISLRGRVSIITAFSTKCNITSASWLMIGITVDAQRVVQNALLDALRKLERLEMVGHLHRNLPPDDEVRVISALQGLRELHLAGYEVGLKNTMQKESQNSIDGYRIHCQDSAEAGNS
jgi:hypothetical protein